ncbi:MAG: pseudouridine-5'-phosphate glycosidase [Planctomycetota bacterium]
MPATLEYLETRGVPVVAVGQTELPGFYARTSGIRAPLSVPDLDAAAMLTATHLALGLGSSVLLCVPIPEADALPAAEALADIDRAILTVLDLPAGTLQSRQRTWQTSGPRMLAMYLARKHTSATYSEVGQHFGKRSHSTAVAAEKRVQLWLADQENILLGTKKTPVKDLLERVEIELAR